MLINQLTLLDAAMPIDLHLPPTSVGGDGLVCVLGPDYQPFVLSPEF